MSANETSSIPEHTPPARASITTGLCGDGSRAGVLADTVAAVRLVLAARAYRLLALALFVPLLALYAITLPATYTGGYMGWVSLRHMDLRLALFALGLSTLLSLVLTMNAYALRRSLRHAGKGLSAGAVLASVLPSSLCCTSVVPSLLALAGASTPQIFHLSGRIQGFIASHETAILGLSLLLLAWALGLASHNLRAACVLRKL